MARNTFSGSSDSSRYAYTAALSNHRSETILQHWDKFRAYLENISGTNVLIVRSDNGGEYMKEFKQSLEERGITHQKSVRYTSQQNGIAEWFN